MNVTRKAVIDFLKASGFAPLDVRLSERQFGKPAPASITVTFTSELQSRRLYDALKTTSWEIGHGTNGRHFVVTMFG